MTRRTKQPEFELLDHWQEAITANINADGYFVGASPLVYRIGDKFGTEELGVKQPFHVIGTATLEDCMRQLKRGREICGEDVAPPPLDWHFYKLGTD